MGMLEITNLHARVNDRPPTAATRACRFVISSILCVRSRRAALPPSQLSERACYPTLPSSDTPSSFCASTANSIGSSRNTSLQKPLTMRFTASSVLRPRWRQ